mgnify:CR=1 FL=1
MYRSYDSIVIKSNGGITDYCCRYYRKRLQKALEVGATAVINGKEENTVERMMQLTEGRGFDLGIETAGTQITATQLIQGANKRRNNCICRI